MNIAFCETDEDNIYNVSIKEENTGELYKEMEFKNTVLKRKWRII